MQPDPNKLAQSGFVSYIIRTDENDHTVKRVAGPFVEANEAAKEYVQIVREHPDWGLEFEVVQVNGL